MQSVLLTSNTEDQFNLSVRVLIMYLPDYRVASGCVSVNSLRSEKLAPESFSTVGVT
jgi:hypothetical protein